MGNTDKNAVGYVLIGVADNIKDAQRIKNKYNEDYIKVGKFYITGINGEVKEYCTGYDAYFAILKNALDEMPIVEYYKRQIGSKMRLVNYHDKAVIILKIISDQGAIMFNNNYYMRLGASNDSTPVSPELFPEFFSKFS